MGVLLLSMLSAILAVIAVALILSGILAGRVSRRITRPLNTLDLEHPLETTPTRSFRPCCADWSTSGVRSTISCVLCAAGPRSLNRSPPA